ncbi:MAG: TonB-dependent receptor plug domain-containing protein [Deltaproteobacteria bacterium]|nr:TonB-dependent receptor plug domain-containing protein [Deltaproteobacteria bacterium]
MNRNFKLFFTIVFLVAFIFMEIPSSYAQDIGSEEFTLEEITVTAQKRAENQQKVAIAMEVISGDEMKELGRNDIDDILSNVSSAMFNKDSDGLRVVIRGVADDKPEMMAMPTTAPIVALNTDGVFSNRKASGNNLYDLERVEVLFGPQSTLYASTSFGGIINVVTGSPKTDKFEVSGTLEYGNYALVRTEGYMNAPLSDTVALRAAFSSSSHDGYISNGTDDQDMKSARVKALFQPNDKGSFLLTGEIVKDSGIGPGSVVAFKNQDDADDPWTAYSTAAGSNKNNITRSIYANIDYDFGFATLSLVPAYSKKTNSNVQAGLNAEDVFVTSTTEDVGKDKGLEGRLASNDGSFIKWIVGFNWYKSEYTSVMTATDLSWRDNLNAIDIKAGYGNITYPVTNLFRVTGGIRFSKERNYTHQVNYPDMFTGGLHEEFSDVRHPADDPDYKVGIEYDLSENSMLFIDNSTSYRTNKGEINNKPLPYETLDAYSFGAKNRFLENKLQLNATAYYYIYKNYLAVGGGTAQFYRLTELDGVPGYTGEGEAIPGFDPNGFRTTGDMNVYGLDLQSSTIVSSKDKLDLNISYSHSEWTRLYFDFPQYANDLGMADLDYKGMGKPFDPHWVINAAYSHNFTFPNGGIFTPRIDIRFQSETFMEWNPETITYSTDGWYTPIKTSLAGYRTQEAYYLANITGIYADIEGRWTLTAYVKNITEYAVKQSSGTRTMRIGSPRTYGAVFSVKY